MAPNGQLALSRLVLLRLVNSAVCAAFGVEGIRVEDDVGHHSRRAYNVFPVVLGLGGVKELELRKTCLTGYYRMLVARRSRSG